MTQEIINGAEVREQMDLGASGVNGNVTLNTDTLDSNLAKLELQKKDFNEAITKSAIDIARKEERESIMRAMADRDTERAISCRSLKSAKKRAKAAQWSDDDGEDEEDGLFLLFLLLARSHASIVFHDLI